MLVKHVRNWFSKANFIIEILLISIIPVKIELEP